MSSRKKKYIYIYIHEDDVSKFLNFVSPVIVAACLEDVNVLTQDGVKVIVVTDVTFTGSWKNCIENYWIFFDRFLELPDITKGYIC